MDSEKKMMRHKASVLELASVLGNVAEACRRRGVSRTQFYEWKRRFQTHWLEGLWDLPPIVKNHPFTTPPEVVERIKELAMLHVIAEAMALEVEGLCGAKHRPKGEDAYRAAENGFRRILEYAQIESLVNALGSPARSATSSGRESLRLPLRLPRPEPESLEPETVICYVFDNRRSHTFNNKRDIP